MKKIQSHASLLLLVAGLCCAAPAMALTQLSNPNQADTLSRTTQVATAHGAAKPVTEQGDFSANPAQRDSKTGYGDSDTYNAGGATTARATPRQDQAMTSVTSEPGIASLLLIGLGLLVLRVRKQGSVTFRD